jgi:hypothetical protein
MSNSHGIGAASSSEHQIGARAYTVIDTWQSGRVMDREDGIFRTRPFAFNRGPWAMVWSVRGKPLRICVRQERNGSPATSHEAVNTKPGQQGISYVRESGTFSLEIEGAGDWVVKVVAMEELSRRFEWPPASSGC